MYLKTLSKTNEWLMYIAAIRVTGFIFSTHCSHQFPVFLLSHCRDNHWPLDGDHTPQTQLILTKLTFKLLTNSPHYRFSLLSKICLSPHIMIFWTASEWCHVIEVILFVMASAIPFCDVLQCATICKSSGRNTFVFFVFFNTLDPQKSGNPSQ